MSKGGKVLRNFIDGKLSFKEKSNEYVIKAGKFLDNFKNADSSVVINLFKCLNCANMPQYILLTAASSYIGLANFIENV